MAIKALGKKVLWYRARGYIDRYQPELIGVTGSFGKTLTKEAIALALADDKHVRASHKSYNTPVGVALSVLGVRSAAGRYGWVRLLASSKVREMAEAEPDTIVLEVGADRPGDIDFVASRLPFRIGVVTAIGSAHLRLFASKEMVAHEKMSLITSLPKGGTAVLSADDPLTVAMKDHTQADIIFFGEAQHAHVRLGNTERLHTSGFVADITVDNKTHTASFPHLAARHQLTSVLAALAVCKAMGISIPQALNDLKDLRPPAGRMRVLKGVNGSAILDDSYNSSPEAALAALTTLAAVPATKRIAILGDMLDLGAYTKKAHQLVGQKVIETADMFIAVGEEMREAQEIALRTSTIDTHHFNTSQDAGKWIADYVQKGNAILVKGSRDMRMELAVKRLLASQADESQLVH